MILEIIISAIIVCGAIYIMYKNIKTKAIGKCSCCDGHCENCISQQQKN